MRRDLCAVRHARPDVVIETGVAHGIAQASPSPIHAASLDVYRGRRHTPLVAEVGKLQLIIRDSLRTARNTVRDGAGGIHHSADGVILIDDIRGHGGFVTFAERHPEYDPALLHRRPHRRFGMAFPSGKFGVRLIGPRSPREEADPKRVPSVGSKPTGGINLSALGNAACLRAGDCAAASPIGNCSCTLRADSMLRALFRIGSTGAPRHSRGGPAIARGFPAWPASLQAMRIGRPCSWQAWPCSRKAVQSEGRAVGRPRSW